MRAIVTAIVVGVVATWTSPSVAAAPKALPALDGYWSGWIERGGYRTVVSVRLAQNGETIGGDFDWPALGYTRVAILSGKFDNPQGSRLRISLPLPYGALRLIGDRGDKVLAGQIEPIARVAGEFKSLGAGGRFELRRMRQPPAPYAMIDLTIPSQHVRLGATLYQPRGRGAHAGVVFVAGSGDAARGEGGFIADRLARSGVAVIVYDKRGVGASTGDWREGGFEERAADATAVLRLLQSRPGIYASQTGFICQSEGCWVAPIAVRQGARAHFLAAISGPTVPVAEHDLNFYRVVLTGAGYGPDALSKVLDLVRASQRVSLGTESWDDFKLRLEAARSQPWFSLVGDDFPAMDDKIRQFEKQTLGYEPKADQDALAIPSLWLYGDADKVLDPASNIAGARAIRAVPRPTVRVITGADHALSIWPEGRLPRTASGYPDVLIDWILRQRPN